jgi:hypothetical protein
MRWIPVSKRLPEIPEGKYGVSVLVAEFDHVYEEIRPGKGYTVRAGHYSKTKDRNGNPISEYYDSPEAPECDFIQMTISMKGGVSWMPVLEEITHWMYFPEPPMYPRRKQSKDEQSGTDLSIDK